MARIFIRFKKGTMDEETLSKALSHKYIRRIPKLTGKGWNYIYKETFQKPIQALKELFGITEKRIDNDYEKNNIQKDYGADKKTFAAHVLEFFTNKTKWTNLFSKKEAQQKYKKPVKQSDVNKKASEKGSEKTSNKDNKKGEKKSFINRSLMRKVWSIYSTEGKAATAAEEETEKAKEIIRKMLEEDRKDKKKVLSIIRNTDKATLTASDVNVIWDTVTQIFSKKVGRTVVDIGVSPEEKMLNIALQSVQNSKYDRENERSNESIVKLLEADLQYRMQHREDEGDEMANKVLEDYTESFKHNRELEWEENAINTAIKFIENNDPYYKENESEEAIQKQRISLVNKVPVIEGEKPLKVPKKNYINVIEEKAEELNSLLKNNKIVCTCLQKQVKGCNVNHLSKKKGKPRSYENALNHGAYIPFVVPVLENGITDPKMDRAMKHGSVSHEIVCRAKVDEKKIGISVIVAENNDGVSVQMISVFKIDDPKNLIKSHGFIGGRKNAIGYPSLP